MWNPRYLFIFFYVLCVSGTWLQCLLFFQKPGTTNCLPFAFPVTLQASECHVCFEDFLALVDQKPLIIENYATLNKRNVPMQWITTLETWQVLFFVMQCILVNVGTARWAVWAGQLRKLSFLCQYSTNWGTYCFKLTTITINIDWTSTWKGVDFPFNVWHFDKLLKLWPDNSLLIESYTNHFSSNLTCNMLQKIYISIINKFFKPAGTSWQTVASLRRPCEQNRTDNHTMYTAFSKLHCVYWMHSSTSVGCR